MQSIHKWLASLDPYANHLQAPFALAARVYVGWVFLKSGLLKLDDFEQTMALFEYEYRVPVLSPSAAAVAGTLGEVVFGALVIAGCGGRFAPLGLFAVNALAVISYAHVFFSDTGIAGLRQHHLWGFILAMLVCYGMGKWSADAALKMWSERRRR